jgi:hypothetical protein
MLVAHDQRFVAIHNGTHGQLGLIRQTYFSPKDQVKWRIQCRRNFCGHWHATAWEQIGGYRRPTETFAFAPRSRKPRTDSFLDHLRARILQIRPSSETSPSRLAGCVLSVLASKIQNMVTHGLRSRCCREQGLETDNRREAASF